MNKLNTFLTFLLLSTIASAAMCIQDESSSKANNPPPSAINNHFRHLIEKSNMRENADRVKLRALQKKGNDFEPTARDAKIKELSAITMLEGMYRSKLSNFNRLAVCKVVEEGQQVNIGKESIECTPENIQSWKNENKQMSNTQWNIRASLLEYYTEQINYLHNFLEFCYETGKDSLSLPTPSGLNSHDCKLVDKKFSKYDFYVKAIELKSQVDGLNSKLTSCDKTGSYSLTSKNEEGADVEETVECSDELKADFKNQISLKNQDLEYLTAKYKLFKLSKKIAHLQMLRRIAKRKTGKAGKSPDHMMYKFFLKYRINSLRLKLIPRFSRFISAQKIKFTKLQAQKKQAIQKPLVKGIRGRLLIRMPDFRVSLASKLERVNEIQKLLKKFNDGEKEMKYLRDPNNNADPDSSYQQWKMDMLFKQQTIVLPQLYSEVDEYLKLNQKMLHYYRHASVNCFGEQETVHVVDRNEACSTVLSKLENYRQMGRVFFGVKRIFLRFIARITKIQTTKDKLENRSDLILMRMDRLNREIKESTAGNQPQQYTDSLQSKLKRLQKKQDKVYKQIWKLETSPRSGKQRIRRVQRPRVYYSRRVVRSYSREDGSLLKSRPMPTFSVQLRKKNL